MIGPTAEMYREKTDSTLEAYVTLTRYPSEQEICNEVKRLEHRHPGFKVKRLFLP